MSLEPARVAARLAELGRLVVPETIAEGQARLARERPVVARSLAETAARGLAELRALCALTEHLHAPRR
jgi:hypothetical protein